MKDRTLVYQFKKIRRNKVRKRERCRHSIVFTSVNSKLGIALRILMLPSKGSCAHSRKSQTLETEQDPVGPSWVQILSLSPIFCLSEIGFIQPP